MTYSEEQDARDRSQVLAYQRPEVIDPLKELVRRQIGRYLDRQRQERERGGMSVKELACCAVAVVVAYALLAVASDPGFFVGAVKARLGLL